MSIPVACESCGHEFKVRDEAAGRRVKCPECDEVITVERHSRQRRAKTDTGAGKRRGTGSKKGKTASGPSVAVIAGSVAAVVVVVIGLLFVFLRPRGNEATPVAGTPATIDPATATATATATASATAPDQANPPPATGTETAPVAAPPAPMAPATTPTAATTHNSIPVANITPLSEREARFTQNVAYNEFGTKLRMIRDGTSLTVMVGLVPVDKAVPWTKPEDLEFRPDFPLPGQENGFSAGPFLFAAGSALDLQPNISPESFRGLMTINGSEPLQPDPATWYPSGSMPLVPNLSSNERLQSLALKKQLKEIGLAMHNHHETFRRFPVPIVFGPDGKPWHSWRVIILRMLGELELAEAYRFDVPWNPHNLKLLDRMPSFYRDGPGGSKSHTRFLAITGPGTMFPIEPEMVEATKKYLNASQ